MVAAALLFLPHVGLAQDPPAAPRILLDQSPRAVDYQLRRLSDDQLARVERHPDDSRYIPVYYALLTRPAMTDAVREEAMVALMTLENATRTGVVLGALARADADETADPLLRQLLAQPPGELVAERQRLMAIVSSDDAGSYVRQGASVGAILAGEPADVVWASAREWSDGLPALLRGLQFLSGGNATDDARRRISPLVEAAIDAADADADYLAALDALPAVRRDIEAFRLLARHVVAPRSPDGALRALAAIGRIPEAMWPAAAEIEPVVRAVIDQLAALAPDDRAETSAIDALGLADRLVAGLPTDRARSLRAGLRSLGVRVVRLEALFEQVAFDRRWFVVEAGTPVQIVFYNPDAMPHNVVIGVPGSLERIGTQGGVMPLPTDPRVKPFVPDTPDVLFSTSLVTRGNTERLGFTAPTEPGEYIFACTFPGHWVRMYGVMLVVPSLDRWEAAPTVPNDPMTKQPFASQWME